MREKIITLVNQASLMVPLDGGTPVVNGLDGTMLVFNLSDGDWWIRNGNEYDKASEEQHQWCRQLAQNYFNIHCQDLLPAQISLLSKLLA